MGDKGLDRIFSRVADASRSFKARWTFAALRRVDEELFLKLEEQSSLYNQALVTGDEDDIEIQTGGMCRGWAAATARMEAAGADHDAYLEGFDGRTGTRVKISDQMEVRDLCEEDGSLFVSPDEVAIMIGSLDALKEIKLAFPGATLEEARNP